MIQSLWIFHHYLSFTIISLQTLLIKIKQVNCMTYFSVKGELLMDQSYHIMNIDNDYNMLMSSLHVGVSKHLLNEDFDVIWANNYFYQLTGYTKEEYNAKYHGKCKTYFKDYPDDFKLISDAVINALEKNEPGYDAICKMPRKDGSKIWIRFVGTFTQELINGVPVIYVVYTDVDELVSTRITAQQEHQKSIDILQMELMAIECIKQIYEVDNIKDCMNSLLRTLGTFFQAERAYMFEIIGNKMSNTFEWCAAGIQSQIDFCQDMDISLLTVWKEKFDFGESAIIMDVMDMKEINEDAYEVLAKQGITSLMASPINIKGQLIGYIGVDNPNVNHIVNISIMETLCYFVSISIEKTNLNERLIYNSFYDELTGVYNRNKYLQDIAILAQQQDTSLGIVYMDINGLKDINDSMGHSYGDHVLIQGAAMLKKVFSNANTYRIGGDEFVVLIQNIEEEEFYHKVNSLKNYIILNTECKGAVGYIWTKDTLDLNKKITDADEFMYQDKMQFYRNNPNSKRYRFNTDNIIELAKKSVLQKALANDRFEVYLQPKVDFERSIIGSEALIRYRDDDGFLVSPNEFIPSLEDARVIRYVDFYVFEKVCMLLEHWGHEGIPSYPVSVNFSRYTLRLPDFIDQLEQVWNKYHIDKHLIEIEIIENDENADNEFLIAIMKKIKKAGFAISIDDFGARYSNMALFINAQLDTLKIDKSLMNGIEDNQRSQMLIGSLAHICHNLDIQLIVEGVETQAQFDILSELECDGIQGYFISRPITIQQFEKDFIMKDSILLDNKMQGMY